LEIAGVVVGQWGGSADKNKVRAPVAHQPQLNQVNSCSNLIEED
jgi:hypothetical protein